MMAREFGGLDCRHLARAARWMRIQREGQYQIRALSQPRPLGDDMGNEIKTPVLFHE